MVSEISLIFSPRGERPEQFSHSHQDVWTRLSFGYSDSDTLPMIYHIHTKKQNILHFFLSFICIQLTLLSPTWGI